MRLVKGMPYFENGEIARIKSFADDYNGNKCNGKKVVILGVVCQTPGMFSFLVRFVDNTQWIEQNFPEEEVNTKWDCFCITSYFLESVVS